MAEAAPKKSWRALRWIASAAIHGGIAAAVFALKPPRHDEVVAISIVEAKNQTKKPRPAEEPPHPGERSEPKQAAPRPAQQARPAPRADSAPPAQQAGPASGARDLDLNMSNGPGGIPMGGGDAPPPAPSASTSATPIAKTLGASDAPSSDDCSEPPTKPKPKGVPQPAYPESARADGIQGKVRVEVTVGENGSVVGARVVSGLGHGLDEAALAAARSATFVPGGIL